MIAWSAGPLIIYLLDRPPQKVVSQEPARLAARLNKPLPQISEAPSRGLFLCLVSLAKIAQSIMPAGGLIPLRAPRDHQPYSHQKPVFGCDYFVKAIFGWPMAVAFMRAGAPVEPEGLK